MKISAGAILLINVNCHWQGLHDDGSSMSCLPAIRRGLIWRAVFVVRLLIII